MAHFVFSVECVVFVRGGLCLDLWSVVCCCVDAHINRFCVHKRMQFIKFGRCVSCSRRIGDLIVRRSERTLASAREATQPGYAMSGTSDTEMSKCQARTMCALIVSVICDVLTCKSYLPILHQVSRHTGTIPDSYSEGSRLESESESEYRLPSVRPVVISLSPST
jgi:hypothetical protein